MDKPVSYKDDFTQYIQQLQEEICKELELIDGKSKFKKTSWQRDAGGGGITKIIQNGNVFEKGGVSTSVVFGKLPRILQKKLDVQHADFFACGLSLVIHPLNPFVPTIHANFRYFELYQDKTIADQWFGGGTDLTPYYIFPEDIVHFHKTLKGACDRFSPDYYASFKKQCDEYFYNPHRDEARGVGGIFFDYLRPSQNTPLDHWYDFVKTVGNSFIDSYLPIVHNRKEFIYTEAQKYWQEIRRGRYVEFNLIHDRGTLFGLKTRGRTESILMSLPPRARWDYEYQVEPGSEEEKMIAALEPRDWINDKIIA